MGWANADLVLSLGLSHSRQTPVRGDYTLGPGEPSISGAGGTEARKNFNIVNAGKSEQVHVPGTKL